MNITINFGKKYVTLLATWHIHLKHNALHSKNALLSNKIFLSRHGKIFIIL